MRGFKLKKYQNLLEEELRRIVERLKNEYHPHKIILFGSLAEGKIDENSDIDLVVVKQTKKNPWERMKEVDYLIEHKVPVELLVYTPQEIKERVEINDFFVKEILKKGKVLYEK
jgi:predicted nucleotidyltransferase